MRYLWRLFKFLIIEPVIFVILLPFWLIGLLVWQVWEEIKDVPGRR